MLDGIQLVGEKLNFASPTGFMLAAIRHGKVVKANDYQKLIDAEQKKIEEKIVRLQEERAQGPCHV